MNFLSKFRTLISSENGQVVPRQYFWVQFSYIGINSIIPIDDIGLYIRGFDLPNLSLDEDGAVVIKNPRGTYKVPGDYIVKLKITDSRSIISEVEKKVTVTKPKKD
jgi:hypothetical protein